MRRLSIHLLSMPLRSMKLRSMQLRSMKLLSLPLLACALLVAGCGSDAASAGGVTVTFISDGSFDASRVQRLSMRIDDDAGSTMQDVPLSGSLSTGVTTTFQVNVTTQLVVSGTALDENGLKIASGIAQPVQASPTTSVSITVVLSSSGRPGMLADAGSADLAGDLAGADLGGTSDDGPPVDIAIGPDLPTPPDLLVTNDLPVAFDLAAIPDLAMMPPPDLAMMPPPDLAMMPPPDLAMMTPPDLTVRPDLAPLPDLATPPDLLMVCDTNVCPLGCNANRCLRPFPTNLAQPPQEAQFASDVNFAADTLLDTATGKATQNGQPVNLGFTFYVDNGTQPMGAPRLAVFAAKSFTLAPGVRLRLYDSANGNPGNAALFITSGDITLSGTVEAGAFGNGLAPGAGRAPGPGGYFGSNSDAAGGGPANCGGGSGRSGFNGDDGGGGGGASAGKGGNGARGGFTSTAGGGGTTTYNMPSPLRGGCGGGSGSNSVTANQRSEGGGGGGGLEFSAGGTLTIGAGALIDTAGNGGAGSLDVSAAGAGGAGGMVVLEGATVNVVGGAFIAENGGGGGAGGNGNGNGGGTPGQPGPPSATQAKGGASQSPGGGGGFVLATTGQNAPQPNSVNGGAGGGGIGLLFNISGRGIIAANTSSAILVNQKVTKTY